jgi:hypothetical protein
LTSVYRTSQRAVLLLGCAATAMVKGRYRQKAAWIAPRGLRRV